PGRIALAVAPFEIGKHALEGPLDLVDATTLVVTETDLLALRAVEDRLLRRLRQVAPFCAGLEAVMLAERLDRLPVIGRLAPRPRRDRALEQRQPLVGHPQPGIEEELDPEPVAFRTGAERRVEGEEPRRDLGDGEAAYRTGEVLREGRALRLAFPGRGLQDRDTVGKVERGTEGIGE